MTSPTPPATGWNAATNALIELLTRMECDALAGRPPGRTALDAAHAAIRPLTRPDSPSGWQPIDSAPKDGTWFLICRAGEGFDSYEVGCHSDLRFPNYVEVEGGLYRKEMEVICEWQGFNNMHRATHWRLLPEPPSPREA